MNAKRSAVALGLFDGVHIGHRAVLGIAAESGYESAVFTFDPEAVWGKSGTGFIYTKNEKAELIKSCGIDNIYSVAPSEVWDMSGEEFAREILVGRMNAGMVSCGSSFRFGKGASCGIPELVQLGKRLGFEVRTADDVKVGGTEVSSTLIRRVLLEGDMKRAEELLGMPYAVSKEAVHGAHLGSSIGFPTINQVFGDGQLVPLYGVYASETVIGGVHYNAVTNIGMKPTVDYGGMPLAETHIIGFSGDLYGRRIHVGLKRFIRPEQRFGSVEQLREQIKKDTAEAILNEDRELP